MYRSRMLHSNRIVVLGAAGHVGNHFVDRLLKELA